MCAAQEAIGQMAAAEERRKAEEAAAVQQAAELERLRQVRAESAGVPWSSSNALQ